LCECGKKKRFIFQLSSDDPEEKNNNAKAEVISPHHMMIGDAGRIYFYVCEDCGEDTVESYWDCF